MKLSVTQENLAKGLSIVGRSVGTRTALPVLNNILLQTENGRLKLSATDLEIGVHTWVGAKVDMDGAITVPAKLLLDYINTNRDKKIDLELKESTLSLTSDHYKANIKGIEASEFPLIPQVKKDICLEVNTKDLQNAIGKTIIATALDESRPVLAGVYVKASESQLKTVATDSYRLAENSLDLIKKIEKEVNLIIPQRTMAELARVLNESIDKVLIYPGENQIEFAMDQTVLVSRLIEGQFPDYEQIIPKNSKTKIEVATSEFASALKMASLFAKESANNIKINIAKEKIQVKAISPHVGDNISEISGTVEGESLEIAFNAKFVLDVLAVVNSDKVTIELSGNLAPAILRGSANSRYLYVIMPLRVDE